jgi:hypothetical protein
MRKMARMAGGGLLLLGMMASMSVHSQDAPIRSPEELDQLVGPIALYPDPLIAEILPAATFPTEIVSADRYISQGGDPNQAANEDWDPSVQGLTHYPTLLKWMDDNITWTTQLGQAFASQQSDVMTAIQGLRAQAQNLGNLPTTPQETVSDDNGDIEIEPANPDDMWIPDYPVDTIYDQPGIFCTFGPVLPIGVWLVFDWNWHDHHLIWWGPGHPRPGNWWHQTPGERHSFIAQNPGAAWSVPTRPPVTVSHYDRGFAEQPMTGRALAIPSGPPPRAAEHAEATREPVRSTAPAYTRTYSAPSARVFSSSEPAGGAFGGFQNGREAQQSSFRGQASRAEIRSSGGSSFGGASHGGGGTGRH